MQVNKYRRLIQAISFSLFLFLLLKTAYPLELRLIPIDLFPRLSPLLALTTTIANRALIVEFWLCLIIMGLTLILGRVFCGWFCPLGTMIELLPVRQQTRVMLTGRWQYSLLILLLVSSLFGFQISGWLDPLSLISRSFSLLLYPHLWLSQKPPFLTAHLLALITLLAILLLSILSRRYWCKGLCPLGALLGLISSIGWLKKVGNDCTGCGQCQKRCPMEAISDHGMQTSNSDCIRCFSCYQLCQQKAVSFRFISPSKRQRIGISRREAIGGLCAGLLSVGLLKVKPQVNQWLIRPPGALPENRFLSTCLRCGLCIKACLTNGLQPCLLEAGLEGLWTPRLSPSIGYCEYNCTLCGQVCPSGAIRRLSEEEKVQQVMGIAVIDRNRCLPWARDKNCLVCEEMCPVPTKAIALKRVKKGNRLILQPYIITERCIGCGACENRCPLQPKSAIRVQIIH